MKRALTLLAVMLGTVYLWGEISVKTIVYDNQSQPPIVGGIIDGNSNDILKKGIIVSVSENTLSYNSEYETTPYYYNYDDAAHISDSKDYKAIDCSNINKEQFFCPILLLKSDMDYYVKTYVILKNQEIVYGNTEIIHSQRFNRYDGAFDVANVWHAFTHTLFDLVTDEIIDPDNGFYYSTNENPRTVKHQVGTGYNTCYKYATEWNYKLWYYHNTVHSDKNKMINLPVMSYSNGKLLIEKNPLDTNKDITFYYSINGNYFRPETYTEIYTNPIVISEPCTVYCYAISSDGYISYTNMYMVEKDESEDFGKIADYVDLGLSVKWASWNIGAEAPEGKGNLYAWGELEAKNDYSSSTYKFYNESSYTKYGSIDNKYHLDDEDDVARQKWGENWRIPTIEELKELKEKCTFNQEVLNGIPVTKVTGPNGNYIFFPYPGNYTETTLYFENSVGSYWSSDLDTDSYALDLDFSNDSQSLNGDTRYHGQSIRPVYVTDVNPDNNNNDDFGKVADYVDLGLTSGTLWASCNIGASSPEEYGDYFAWGETAPKSNYDWSTYIFGGESNFTKYNSSDGLTELELEDDAAYVICGKDWRMPTHNQELELVNECSWEDYNLNGISGYKITGPNGNSIFMPRGGLYDGTDYARDGNRASNVNTGGWYWSSTLNYVSSSYAQGLCFYPSLLANVSDHERSDGHNIRPVYVGNKESSSKIADYVDLGLSVKWASWNIGANAPEADGYLLAWGELAPKKDYSASTYKFYNGGYTKYGYIDNKYTLDKEDDAAYQLWGSKWRMPTIEELIELEEKCNFTLTELNGVPVTKVTGPNGNFIYFPFPGNFTGDNLYFKGSVGSYWSSTLDTDSYALDLDFSSDSQSLNGDTRYHGQSIRPVYVEIIPDDEGGSDYSNGSDINEDTDLNGNIIGNIYYNIGDENGEYSSAEGCIILRKSSSDDSMEGTDLFGEDLKNNYTGMIFMVQGSGTIKVNAETVGLMALKVKIGSNYPFTMELEGKMNASFPYSVTAPTYVYIYGSEKLAANTRGLMTTSGNTLKIFSIEWNSTQSGTSIRNINLKDSDNKIIFNIQGQRMQSIQKGINIINGKKVIIK